MQNNLGQESVTRGFDGIEFGEFKGRVCQGKYLGLISFWYTIVAYLYMSYYFTGSVVLIMLLLALWIMAGINLLLLQIRRLHDINRAGWWSLIWILLISLIPIAGMGFSYLLAFVSGSKTTNDFGDSETVTTWHYYAFILVYICTLVLAYFLKTL